MKPSARKPSPFFWVASIALLLWGIGGATIYIAYFVETPQEFAETAETAVNREGYAEYVSEIPAWAITVGILAAVARLLGAACLLLRRSIALQLYIISTALFLVALYRAFVMADVAEVMSGGHIAIEVVFLALSFFGIWLSYSSRVKGILR